MKPNLFRCAAIAISAANHVRVSHAPLLLRHSFQETTPVMRSTDRPQSAAATLLIPTEAPPIHRATVPKNAAALQQ